MGMSVYVYNDGTHPGHGHIYVLSSSDTDIVIGTDPITFVVQQSVSGHADDLAVDDGNFSILAGTNAQSVLDSADNAIQLVADTVDSVVGAGATDLGTFTGTTIADNDDIKGALQSLETAVESAGSQYADNKVELVSQTNTAGTWTTITHGLNEDRLSSVSFFDEGNNYQNLNSAVLWRPKSGDANSIEVYHSQAKTMTIVFRI